MGIIKKMEDCGRIVISKEVREKLEVEYKVGS